jgi:hypothetical protein
MTDVSRGQYWLLTRAIEMAIPLWCLPHRVAEMHFQSTHGLDDDQLVAVLRGLFDERRIVAVGHRSPPTDAAIVSEMRSRPPSARENCLYYRLTRRGAELWESLSNPHWGRYLTCCDTLYPSATTRLVEIASQNRQLITSYAELVFLRSETIVAGSERRGLLRPWKATYWKWLPFGYRLRFRCRYVEPAIPPTKEEGELLDAVNNWYSPPNITN